MNDNGQDVSSGRQPTPDELFWNELSKRFTPDRQLDFVTNRAEKIVTQVTLVGTFLGAGGLIAISSILTHETAVKFALVAIALAGLAVLIALITQAGWRRTLHPGNIVELKAWFNRYSSWRGYFLISASWLVIIAILAAAVAAGVALSSRNTRPTVGFMTELVPETSDKAATITATASIKVHPSSSTDIATAMLLSAENVVATSSQGADNGGAIEIEITANELAADAPLRLTVSTSNWSCELDADANSVATIDCAAS
jgi:hypothetical protein